MTIEVPEVEALGEWIELTFSRSPGPGGQNVNKVNTRVTLLFDFEACTLLSDTQKTQILRRFRTRMSRDGRLRIVRHRERTQPANRTAAEQQLVELLTQVSQPRKTRRATKPTLGSKRRRLADKRRRSQLKQQRGSRGED